MMVEGKRNEKEVDGTVMIVVKYIKEITLKMMLSMKTKANCNTLQTKILAGPFERKFRKEKKGED